MDFDGTIVEHRYPDIGRELPFAVETLKQLIKDRHQLILWTVREGRLLDEAVEWCRRRGVALRIGVNHGSLAKRIVDTLGDTPEGMVASAMEFLRICRREKFDQVVVSMKSSNTRVMVCAYRRLVAAMRAEGMDYPLHLGVTEAGNGIEGRVKSAVGIGALLADGIGDTIRVKDLDIAKDKDVDLSTDLETTVVTVTEVRGAAADADADAEGTEEAAAE